MRYGLLLVNNFLDIISGWFYTTSIARARWWFRHRQPLLHGPYHVHLMPQHLQLLVPDALVLADLLVPGLDLHAEHPATRRVDREVVGAQRSRRGLVAARVVHLPP